MKVHANLPTRPLGLPSSPPARPTRSFQGVLAHLSGSGLPDASPVPKAASPEPPSAIPFSSVPADGEGGLSDPVAAELDPAQALVDEARQSRALGFDELGVFGVTGAQASAEIGGLGEPASALQTRPDLPQDKQTRLSLVGASLRLRPRLAVAAAASDVVEATPLREGVAAGSTTSADGFGAPILTPALMESDQPDEAPAPSRRPAQSAEAEDHLAKTSVIVAERDGVVQVVAAAILTPDARLRLRRAADTMAADLGLTLTDFTLNGGTLEPAAPQLIGAPYGARPR